MCQKCVDQKSDQSLIMADCLIGRSGSYSITGRGRSSPKPAPETKDESSREYVPLVLPSTFRSFVLGVLQGGNQTWISKYIESEFFELARQEIKSRAGFDIQMVIMACVALNAARVKSQLFWTLP